MKDTARDQNTARVGVLVLFCAIVLVAGCKTKSWTRKQFEGTWQMESGEVAPSQTAVGATTIRLDHNGGFVAKALPPDFLFADEGVPANNVLSGRGSWSLRQFQDEQRLQLTFQSVEVNTGVRLPYGAELFIESSNGNPRLYYFKGDPDEGQRITFQRR